MTREIPTIYDSKTVEHQAAALWKQGQYYHADETADSPRGTYAIVIPPPNVTAALHLGHALNNTLQDVLIRWRRMQGYATLWMPGTDHAGIATQTVVEKQLLAEHGKRRTDFARHEFVQHVQTWKDEFEARILGQLESMGCSCDWPRTRFTMDDVCAKAVRTNFFNLFKDGLIYRGKRLVNWDPATQTVLADDEVEHESVQGFFWYMQYPLLEPVEISGTGFQPVNAGTDNVTGEHRVSAHGQDAHATTGRMPVPQKINYVTVATTRPETMLGDTAVAMNPSDPRAKYLVGKMVRLPIVGRLIPIVADEHVVLPNPDSDDEKAKFSTGFLKVTPAHDPDDWAIGQRHDLDIINVMAPDGSISDKHGWDDADAPEAQNLLGMDRFEAREAIVEWFRQEKLLEDVRDYTHEVGHSYRSHVPIEPYLSDQWYIAVKKPIENFQFPISNFQFETETRDGVTYIKGTDVPVNSLAGLALTPLLDGRVRFIPERYTKNYQNWLENLRDWPISRQLWWGHQIPVWSKDGKHENRCEHGTFSTVFEGDQGPITYACVRAGFEELEKTMEAEGWVRDEDVLDTWFSSALWPFSTMGWPEENETLKKFYPTQVLCTAREIITLWVSRMVMMGQYCVGDIPYSDVYIHAMIQDGQGRKMSKSLGNGIDPLVAIDSHGADAMRFTLASMTTDTQDVRMPVAPIQLPDGRTVNSSPKFDLGRSFCNKLWNASRFAMLNLEGTDPAAFDAVKMDTTDKWILSRLAKTIVAVTDGLEAFKYKEPLDEIYRFFWNDFCDWYLEWTKPRMQERGTGFQPVDAGADNAAGDHGVSAHGQDARATAQNVLAFVLDQVLRLLHPFVPFITEGIFQNLNAIAPKRGLKGIMDLQTADSIMIAQWPELIDGCVDEPTERQIETVQNVIRAIRDVRSQYTIPPARPLVCSASAPDAVCDMLNKNLILIQKQAFIESLTIETGLEKPDNAAAIVIGDIQIYVHDAVDKEAERNRLEKQKDFIAKGIMPLAGKLGNENFTSRAKPEVVEQSRQKLKELQDQLAAVEKLLAELN